jgi:uncharacterized protein (DUF3084 family)
MQFIIAGGFLLVLTLSASAQQSPSQTAIQIDTIINQWAQVIEAQQKQISEQQKEIADLKAKYEPADKAAAQPKN